MTKRLIAGISLYMVHVNEGDFGVTDVQGSRWEKIPGDPKNKKPNPKSIVSDDSHVFAIRRVLGMRSTKTSGEIRFVGQGHTVVTTTSVISHWKRPKGQGQDPSARKTVYVPSHIRNLGIAESLEDPDTFAGSIQIIT